MNATLETGPEEFEDEDKEEDVDNGEGEGSVMAPIEKSKPSETQTSDEANPQP